MTGPHAVSPTLPSPAVLWDSQTNQVSIAVDDEPTGDSFEVEVDPLDALGAFWHPYAYAYRDHPADALAA